MYVLKRFCVCLFFIFMGLLWITQGNAMLANYRALYKITINPAENLDIFQARPGATGTLLYEFTGNECHGYSTVSESHLIYDKNFEKENDSEVYRVNKQVTWESASGDAYHFLYSTFVNDKLVEDIKGKVQKNTNSTTKVSLEIPHKKEIIFNKALVFPTSHKRKLIEAIQQEKNIDTDDYYEASSAFGQFYNVMTVIGHRVTHDEKMNAVDDKKSDDEDTEYWKMHSSFFLASDIEYTPEYEITFEMAKNGFIRHMVYNNEEISLEAEVIKMHYIDRVKC